MANIKAVYEGKISKWNKDLNGGGGTKTYLSIYYLFANGKQKITYKDNDSFIAIQIPIEAIISMKPSKKTVTFVAEDNSTEFVFTIFDINVEDNFTTEIAVLTKDDSGNYKYKRKKPKGNTKLTDGELVGELNNLSADESINCTSSRPPCN